MCLCVLGVKASSLSFQKVAMRGPIKTIFPLQFSAEHLFFIEKLSQTSPYEGIEAQNKLWNVLVQKQGEATTKEYCK